MGKAGVRVRAFESAAGKLEDSRRILEQLAAAKDASSFKALFNSFLSSSRSITLALQKQGAHVEGFEPWYAAKRREMESDELLRFMHVARTEDFHEGKHRLLFPRTHVVHLSTDEIGPPPQPGAALAIGAEGPFWVVDQGTPRERRAPITRADFTVQVALAEPPTSHLGRPLPANDPVTVCRTTLEYLAALVYEARGRFGT